MKKKIIPVIVLTSFLLVLVGGVVAYPSSIEGFLGGSHTGCHALVSPTTESIEGTVTVDCVQGTSLTAGQYFTINVAIINFTEALINDRGSEVSVAVAATRGDNANFGSKLDEPVRLAEITLDGNGDSNVPISFDLIAPTTDGSYTLVVDALSAANSTDAVGIIYASGNVVLTISGGTPAAPGIPGFEFYTLIGVLAVTVSSLIVVVVYWKRQKHFF
ncbi:MAG: hypothetical protein ACFFBH_01990 [Promethearchaeota archaeon]